MPLPWQGVRPSYQVLIGASVGLILLVGSFAYNKWQRRDAEVVRVENSLLSTSTLLAQHASRVFGGVESALREVSRLRTEVESDGDDPQTVHRLLRAVHGGSPVLKTIGWVDANGDRIATSYAKLAPPVNIAESNLFKTLRASPPVSQQPIITDPFYSPILDMSVIGVALRTNGPDGAFTGIAYGMVDPTYFSQVFHSAGLGLDVVATMIRGDGQTLVAEPRDPAIHDSAALTDRLVAAVQAGQLSGTFHTTDPDGGDERIIGFATTQDRRFILTTAVTRQDGLRSFYDELLSGLWTLLITTLIIATVAAALVVQIRRREMLGKRLRENERRFRDFAEASGDWFWETDTDHRMVWMSKAVEQASGTSSEWHLGKRRLEMCAAELMSNPEAISSHQTALDRHLPFSDFEYPRRSPIGIRWIRTSGVPLFDAVGKFTGYRGSARDITDFVDAKERLKDAADALPGGFMLFNAADELIYRNAPSQQPTGIGTVERLGDTFETIIKQSIEQGMVEEAREDPEAWTRWRMERHVAANSTTLVHINGRAIEVVERPTSDGGRVVLRFDVTDREMAYEEIRQARDTADAANQAKSDFLASMSHELRTPLNAIIGFGEILQMMKDRRLSTDQVSEYSGYIVSSGQLLLSLVNDVLDLSTVESGHMKVSLQSVSVRSMIDRAMDSVRPLADQRSIDLQLDIDDAVGNARADGQRAIQVLLNLLSNAIKYNRPNGFVRLQAVRENGQVTILVTDSGPGIAAAKAARLFSPFDRLGAEYGSIEGTGIGLALSRKLIAAMSGQIGYQPADPSGSTFWMSLPGADDADDQTRPPGSAVVSDRIDAHSIDAFRVLCIEDNPINMRIVEHVVGCLPDVTFIEATTGEDGLIQALHARPDVIVLDLNLPDINGYEVLERLLANPETAAIPVIALTAAAMRDEVERGLAQGFFRYLTKPLDFEEFLEVLQTAALNGRGSAADCVTIDEVEQTPALGGGAEDSADDGSATGARDTLSDLIDHKRLADIRSLTPPEIFTRLVTDLCESITRRARGYGDALSKDDLTLLAQDMHALKGECLNMGVSDLGRLADRLNRCAHAGDRSALRQAKPEIEAMSTNTVNRIKNYLKITPQSTASAA
ncbi:MAG: response regulator [Thalassobaculaceae bacterium]|nr:response regulator [Thalassobaculaceae bacterium]